MDWAGIEPAASSMPRKRSTTDLPARSTIVERHWLKELFLCCVKRILSGNYCSQILTTEEEHISAISMSRIHQDGVVSFSSLERNNLNLILCYPINENIFSELELHFRLPWFSANILWSLIRSWRGHVWGDGFHYI